MIQPGLGAEELMSGVPRFRRLAPVCVLLGLAAAVHAAPSDVKALGRDLGKAVDSQSAEQIQHALEALLDHGGPDACEVVVGAVPRLQRANDGTYWQLVSAAAGFRDGPALAFLGDWIVKAKGAPFARDVLFALENNSSSLTTNTLAKVLEKAQYDLQLMAADQLARVHTVEAVDALIAQLKKEGDRGDPELKRRIMGALTAITGESMGDAVNWTGWWDANRKNGLPERHEEAGGHGGAELASQTLDPNRKNDFESMTREPKHVLVISSRTPADAPKDANDDYNYDHMEQVLDQMQVAHTVVLKADFEKEPEKYLRDAWTILVNCNNIQPQCICPDCRRILAEKLRKGTAGGLKNRLYGCPPECSRHDQVCYRMTQQTIDKIKAWVEAGGYLFTEDWGIVEILQPAWPNLVENGHVTPGAGPGGAGGGTEYNVVHAMDATITPGRGLTSLPLLRGVFQRPRPPARHSDDGDGATHTRDPGEPSPAAPPSHQWKIDDESPAIQVKDRNAVTVLMESADLGAACGGNDAVAITFRVGNGSPRQQGAASEPRRGPMTGDSGGGNDAGRSRGRGEWAEELRGGRVLHCISHFGHQQAKREDTFVIQNLILNFIMESNRQHTP
jgi:hypothetical protein